MTLINHAQLMTLRQLAAGDDNFLVSVIDAFLPQLETVPGNLRHALGEGSARGVVDLAHSLKGSSGHVGADEVARLCLAIEQKARADDLEGIAELLGELESVASDTHRLFEEEKAQLT